MIDEDRNSSLTFKAILNAMATPVTVMDRDFVICFVNDSTYDVIQIEPDDVIGKNALDMYPKKDEIQSALTAHLNRVLNGETVTIPAQQYVVKQPGGADREYYWRVQHSPFYDDAGTVTHIIQTSFDVTETKIAEEQRRLISRELDHRVKNLLTTLNAIVNLSGGSADTIDEYRAGLSGRLLAISSAHEHLARSKWEGLSLNEVVELALDPFCDLASERITIKGPPVPLAMKATRDASMLLHEFVSNAAKFGFLSRPDGKLRLEWGLEEETGIFVCNWIEYGMDGIEEPPTEGYGTLLSSTFPNMKVKWDFKPDGLNIRVELDAERLTVTNIQTMG